MAISSFEINGMMGRTQDFSILKHQEDMKPAVDQSVFQNQNEKQVQNKADTVQNSSQSETQQQEKDARDKGSNEYAGDGGRRRKRQDDVIPEEGRVIAKGAVSHFDLRT